MCETFERLTYAYSPVFSCVSYICNKISPSLQLLLLLLAILLLLLLLRTFTDADKQGFTRHAAVVLNCLFVFQIDTLGMQILLIFWFYSFQTHGEVTMYNSTQAALGIYYLASIMDVYTLYIYFLGHTTPTELFALHFIFFTTRFLSMSLYIL